MKKNLEKKRDWKLIGLAILFFVMLCITYSNHFTNGFYFDDFHTINNNTWIRDLKNIPKFFTDYHTMSIDPNNQGSMRPVITTLNAIDYALAGKKYDQRVFHAHMFFNFILLCILLYFLILYLFNSAHKDDLNKYIALICTAWYAHLVGNAETLNYIISRSDSFSTFCIIATFVLFIVPRTKRYYLYLIPLIIGFLSKEVVYVTPFVLFFFIAMTDQQLSIPDLLKLSNSGKIFKTFKQVLPTFIILVLGLFFIFFFYNSDASNLGNAVNHTFSKRMDYFMTQSYCILRYFKNFFLPTDLTADPDIYIIKSWLDLRIIFGLFLLCMLFITAILTSLFKKTRPISFGIIWFYVFLAPTSSFNVMYQISNDHRTFLPYIGLIFSFGWLAALLFYYCLDTFKNKNKVTITAFGIVCLVIVFNAFGVYERNKVWSSSHSLWSDVVEKSPRNPRGLMNYGLTLMDKGKYVEAQGYYEKALGYWPSWFYAHINMGINFNSQGKLDEAENSFMKALNYGKHSPEPYYFYARYLYSHKRYSEAKSYLLKGKEFSPYHANILSLLKTVSNLADADGGNVDGLKKLAEDAKTEDAYIELSLAYSRINQFENSIQAAQKALELNPISAVAYNNIGAGNCALKNWEAAIVACKKALALDPNFERAKGNLNWAQSELNKLKK